jgi:hypothetical protein
MEFFVNLIQVIMDGTRKPVYGQKAYVNNFKNTNYQKN